MFKSQKPENFEQLVERIALGELTRLGAAQEAGINFSTFSGWLARTGALAKLKHTRQNAGENGLHSNAKSDPEKDKAHKDAVAYVLERPNYPLFSI